MRRILEMLGILVAQRLLKLVQDRVGIIEKLGQYFDEERAVIVQSAQRVECGLVNDRLRCDLEFRMLRDWGNSFRNRLFH